MVYRCVIVRQKEMQPTDWLVLCYELKCITGVEHNLLRKSNVYTYTTLHFNVFVNYCVT